MNLKQSAFSLLLLLALPILACSSSTSDSEQSPDETATPIVTLSAEESFEKGIYEAIDSFANKDEEIKITKIGNAVSVQWVVSPSSISQNLTKEGVMIAIYNILEFISQSDESIDKVAIIAFFPFADDFGNTENIAIAQGNYTLETISKINWETFSHTKVYDIADHMTVHKSFRLD